MMKSTQRNFKWYSLATLSLAVIFVWHLVLTSAPDGILTVAFLDVGQGDAIFIEAPGGAQVLIDGGANKKVLTELGRLMPFYDHSIDVVVATHPDQDHVGGLSEVLKKFEVDFVVESELESSSDAYVSFEESISEGTENILTRRGDRISLGGGAYIEILFPDRNALGWDSNTASIITKLVYGDTSFLLTGDSPQNIEKYLVSLDGKDLDVDVLKLGHHGSRTSTANIFLSVTSPQYAIISAGKDNRYGHPHKEVIDMMEKFEIESLATYSIGTIVFESDGESVSLK